jgi:hypothetical protein
MSCEFSQYDGSYVLGALSPTERQEYEGHLADCVHCSRAVRELAGLPGLLSRIDPEAVENPAVGEPVPDTLLPSLVREVRRSQRRRLTWLGGGVAAAAAAVVVISLAVTGGLGGNRDVTATGGATASTSIAPAHAMTQLGQRQLRASVAFENVAWGTRLNLTCTYSPSGDYGHGDLTSYALVVRTKDGRTQQVATWRAVPGRTTTVTAASASRRADIASVEVRTMSGRPVLQLTT